MTPARVTAVLFESGLERTYDSGRIDTDTYLQRLGEGLGGLSGQHLGQRRLAHAHTQADGEQALAAPDEGEWEDPVGKLIHAAPSEVSVAGNPRQPRVGGGRSLEQLFNKAG